MTMVFRNRSQSRNVGWKVSLAKVYFLALTTAFSITAAVAAQEPEIDIDKTTRIALGKSSGQPEQTALIPIYLTPPKSIPVGRVQLRVTFVSANVKFDKVEPGPTADNGKVKFSTDVATAKNESGIDTSTVTILAELSDPSAKSLFAGLLAYLSLRVSANARPAKITLTTSAEASRPGSSDPLPDVRAFGAELEVQAPNSGPMVVCFFFSH